MTKPLPEFKKPPVTEVALSVQFEKLDSVGIPQLGYVWNAFRERFPNTEQHPPLDPVVEQFGEKTARPPEVRLKLLTTPPNPRLWFLNESGSELVQVQQDRFVRNWRKMGDCADYPRYRQFRQLFREDFGAFCQLVEKEGWGAIKPTQCEVTYVNIIPAGNGWKDHGELGRVLTVFSAQFTGDNLKEPEEATVNVCFVLKDDEGGPVGRLRISASPVIRVPDNCRAIRLTLTARGRPDDEETEGVMAFFDRGHEAIVRGFASVTTPEMHEVWERTS